MTMFNAVFSLIVLAIIFSFLLFLIKKTIGFLMWVSGQMNQGAMSTAIAILSIAVIIVLDLFIVKMASSAFNTLLAMQIGDLTDPLSNFVQGLKPGILK